MFQGTYGKRAAKRSCGEIRDMSGLSYFPRLINDFSSAISHWYTVAKMS